MKSDGSSSSAASPPRLIQSRPISASTTALESIASSMRVTKSVPGAIESTSMNTRSSPKRSQRCSKIARAWPLVSPRR
jgi:hypothetical protein